MCKIDSVEHMLLDCTHSKELWDHVNKWIIELGIVDYYMSELKIIVGD